MTVEQRILNNQLAIMCALKDLLRDPEELDPIEVRTDRRWLTNCCRNTLPMLREASDNIPTYLEYI